MTTDTDWIRTVLDRSSLQPEAQLDLAALRKRVDRIQRRRRTFTCGAVFAVVLLLGIGLTVVVAAREPNPPTTASEPSQPEQPTKGPIPPDAYRPDGTFDRSRVPDFVSVSDRLGQVVGYTPSRYLFSPSPEMGDPEPVYAEDLTTLVGHMYPGRGFVPTGTRPEDVPPIPSTTTPTSAPPTRAPTVAN